MESNNEEFHTLTGYRQQQDHSLTESMEDYLEMITRMTQDTPSVGINNLARKLHVRPSSASKMVNKLKEENFVIFKRYGLITLTEQGKSRGEYLLWRHQVLEQFFSRLNHSDGELRQVEQIEHFINEQTVKNLEKLIPYIPI